MTTALPRPVNRGASGSWFRLSTGGAAGAAAAGAAATTGSGTAATGAGSAAAGAGAAAAGAGSAAAGAGSAAAGAGSAAAGAGSAAAGAGSAAAGAGSVAAAWTAWVATSAVSGTLEAWTASGSTATGATALGAAGVSTGGATGASTTGAAATSATGSGCTGSTTTGGVGSGRRRRRTTLRLTRLVITSSFGRAVAPSVRRSVLPSDGRLRRSRRSFFDILPPGDPAAELGAGGAAGGGPRSLFDGVRTHRARSTRAVTPRRLGGTNPSYAGGATDVVSGWPTATVERRSPPADRAQEAGRCPPPPWKVE